LKRLHGFRGAATPQAGRRLNLVTLTAEKNSLRILMRRRRRAAAKSAPDAALSAAKHLPIERFASRTVVASYYPMGAEMDPGPLVQRLAGLGAVLAWPVAIERDAPLIFRRGGNFGDFLPDAFGVAGPPPGAIECVPDLVIAPVLAFDGTGRRLGQGAGSYDRTLQALRACGSVFVLGIAYACQEVTELPADAHDQPLDAILTETGYKEF
jgi:5-formyltetrahydrofolate cyclo-ligase